MPPKADAWLARAQELLQGNKGDLIPGATSLLSAVYGVNSPQLKAFTDALAQQAKGASNPGNAAFYQQGYALGTVQNVVAEIRQGLISNIRTQVAGEVFAELIGLAKETLSDNTESSKNVAAVLVAAAFEDVIRRMGAELAGVAGRPKLDSVLTELKAKGVLVGGETGLAQSYLKFRNDSLHADWANVQRSQIESCVAFLESMLLKHFS